MSSGEARFRRWPGQPALAPGPSALPRPAGGFSGIGGIAEDSTLEWIKPGTHALGLSGGIALAAAAQGVSHPRSDRLRIARLLCVFGVMFFTAGAIAERPERVSELTSDDAPGKARGRVTISSSTPGVRVYRTHASTGRVEIRAATLDFLIRIAYGVHPRDIVYEAPLDRQALYDVIARPHDRDRETAIRLLREQLETTFAFEASAESRLIAVRILRRLAGGTPLQQSTAEIREVVGSRGRFAGTRASMSDLARFTRSLTPEPVVDETGLRGSYDLVMEWDPSAGNHALLQAFADLGLELVDGERSVEQLIIRRPAGSAGATGPSGSTGGSHAKPAGLTRSVDPVNPTQPVPSDGSADD